jgi:hypothetical protein
MDTANPAQTGWDSDDERALRERMAAAGYRMPTLPLARERHAVERRPAWLAFLFSLLRANG